LYEYTGLACADWVESDSLTTRGLLSYTAHLPLSERISDIASALSGGASRAGLDFRLQLVQRAPIFSGLGAGPLAALVGLARDRRIVRRESFFLQGDPASDVYILCAGRLKTTQVAAAGEQIILRLISPGEAFGALGLGAGGQYASGAEALEPSHALLWDRGAFEEIAEQNPVVLRNVVRILSERMRALELSLREIATVRTAGRVASALLRLANQVGRTVDGGVSVTLGREDLAQLTGCTPFTVSRLLADWEECGYVRSRREVVVLVDGSALAEHVASGSRGRGGQAGAAGGA
jgi:CRP-like cAMP-binding protein